MNRMTGYALSAALLIVPVTISASTFSTKNVGDQQTTSSAAQFSNALSNLSDGILNNADINGLGLNFADCGGLPLDDYMLDYLETILTVDASDTDTWQSDIDALSDCDEDGADWMLTNIIDNSSNYPASTLTAAMIDNLLEMDGYTNAVLGASDLDISDLQNIFDSSSISTPLLDASVAALVWETLGGFDTADQAESLWENDDSGNFTLANFQDCYDSSDNNTGGSNECTISASEWSSITTVAAAISGDNASALTSDDITNLVNAEGDSVNTGVDLSNAAHLDYIKDCIDGLSDSASTSDAASCATDATQAEVVSYEVYGIFNDDYDGTVDATMLGNAGIVDNVSSIAAGNTCGENQNESCITAVLASATDITSADDINTNTISTVLADYFEDAVEDESTTVDTASATTGCDSNTTFNVPNPPSLCRSFANWNCTSLTTGISVHWDDNGKGAVRADSSSFTGSSYQLKAKLEIGTVVRTKTLSGTFNMQSAIDGAEQGYKTGTQPGWWANYNALTRARNQCSSWGGTLAKYSEIQAANNAVSGTLVSNNTRVVFRADDGNADSVNTTDSSAGRYQCSQDFKQNSSNQHKYIYDTGPNAPECNGVGNSEAYTYVCKDVPSCD